MGLNIDMVTIVTHSKPYDLYQHIQTHVIMFVIINPNVTPMATIVLPSLRKPTEGDEPRPLRGLESSSFEPENQWEVNRKNDGRWGFNL